MTLKDSRHITSPPIRLIVSFFIAVLSGLPSNRTPAAQTPGVIVTSPSEIDQDGDGVLDVYDNCPMTANPGQSNSNADRFGDACVAPDIRIPAGAKIGGYPVIDRGVKISRGISIGDNVTIGSYVILEEDTIIGHGTIIGDATVVHKDATVGTRVVLGRNVTIGSAAVIGTRSVIGQNAAVGDGASIGSRVIIGEHASVLPGVAISSGTVVPAGAKSN